MVNKNRDYGLDWERELVRRFKEIDSKAARMPNSGAFGTLTGISSLKGDVRFNLDGLYFLIEAKAGYGGSQSISFKREWMDKVIEEAESQRPQRIPMVALKLRGAKTESGKLIVFTLNTFIDFLHRYDKLLEELMKANDFIFSLKEKGIDVTEYINNA
jgi:Holliday junction resolvase